MGAPPFEAMITQLSPYWVKMIAMVRGAPDLRPVLVINRIGAPFQI